MSFLRSATVAMAALAGILVANLVVSQVSLNKINSPSHTPSAPCCWSFTDTASPPVGIWGPLSLSPMNRVLLQRDLVPVMAMSCFPSPAASAAFFDSSASRRRLHAAFEQTQAHPVHPRATPSGDVLTTAPPHGIRHRARLSSAGNEFSTYPSVARCGFHRRLRRPSFNRCLARSLHPVVLASGATSTFRQRVRLRRRHCSCCILVVGPICNTDFFEGLICNMAA
jgi:hypothetical protein